MAAVLATLEAIEQDDMIANASSVEMQIREKLDGAADVAAVHGKGCLLGIEFADKCSPFHAKLLDNKIITGTSSNPYVLRLLPPLCVSLEDVDLFIEQIAGKGSMTSNAA
jgi:4-aminobutyrate aminotransferase and related aminotransferases